MKFKVTKIATAVAAGLGLSAIGMSAAHADRIMFPYIGGSSTVATIITVINQAAAPGAVLHYQLFHKSGAAADNNAAVCQEDSVFRPTSVNDIVTFDLTGKFGGTNGVLFEPAPTTPNYGAQSFALLKPILAAAAPQQARGWLMVDNQGVGAVGPAAPGTMNGEAFMLDFVEGAAWGYVAYNPAPGATAYDFSDATETQGEVIAGARRYTTAGLVAGAVGHSPRVPIAIYPLVGGDLFQKLLVTPINHDVVVTDAVAPAPAVLAAVSDRPGQFGQNATNLKTSIGLSVLPVGSSLIAFNRDEQPIDGTARRDVTCVGAVNVSDLFTALGASQLANGGWSAVRVTSPGPLANIVNGVPVSRTPNTNEAVVMKLEYNLIGAFLGGTGFKGAYNNGYWMRRGHRESLSLPIVAATAPFATSGRVYAEGFTPPLAYAIHPNTNDSVDLGANYKVGDDVTSLFQ
jgi:hypothetical protein